MNGKFFILIAFFLFVCLPATSVLANDTPKSKGPELEQDLKGAKVPLKTDTETFEREAEAMSHDGYSLAERRLLEGKGEKHEFQAEVSRLMHLIINSLYSRRDIFLRELISNASDALDKIRFLALTNQSSVENNPEFEIKIKIDKEAKKLHIFDTGVGMTKADLIANLGTIAKSGTSEFINKAQEGDDLSLIGQFGVGFYSAFLVANRVTVTSKHNEDDQYIWSSEADGNFSVLDDPEGNTLGRGTQVTLHLRDDAEEFLEEDTIRALVKKHSSFINFPIYLWTSKTVQREVEDDEAFDDDVEEDEETEDLTFEEEEGDEEEEEEEKGPKTKTISETVWDWALLNDVKPLWVRDPKDITDDEYIEFYKSSFKTNGFDPITWTHFVAEGDVDFRSILYIPGQLEETTFDPNSEESRGLKLFVKRVFITDDFDAIIPKYLSFVKGMIDSSNLPLNVSREILQQTKTLKAIEKKIVRKIIGMLQQMARDDEERYIDFYDEFRVSIKLGVLEDSSNRDRLSRLLRFYTTDSGKEQISLETYITRMKETQEKIYYIAGESKSVVSSSPLLEKLVSRGYEVLFMTDPIDEYWTQHLTSFDGKKLVNIAKEGDLGIDSEEEKEKIDELAKEYEDLSKFFKDILSSRITKCTVTKRLTKTPSALVASSFGYSANLERILKSQALATGTTTFMAPKKILEINPTHPIIQELRRLVEINREDPIAIDLAEVIYETAALHGGFVLDNPNEFAHRVHRIISRGLSIPLLEEDNDERVAFDEEVHNFDD